jgi:hypothetical protein
MEHYSVIESTEILSLVAIQELEIIVTEISEAQKDAYNISHYGRKVKKLIS